MDKTLTKGLQLLEIIAASPKACGVKDLAEATGLTQSNVHRLLQSLMAMNYIQQEGRRGQYSATPRLYAIGRFVIDRLDIGNMGMPGLQRLNAQTHEFCSLSIWHNGAPLIVRSVETSPNHPNQLFSQAMLRTATTCSSAGQVHLAYQPDEVIAEFAANLVPATPYSLSTPEALYERLASIRKTGKVYVRDEWRFGLSAVSVPVFAGRRFVASLTISAPSDRLTADVAESYVAPMHAVANDISILMEANATH